MAAGLEKEIQPHRPRAGLLGTTPRVGLVCAFLAIVLFAPAFSIGLFADEYIIVAAIEGSTPHRMSTPGEVYRFSTGVEPDVKAAIDAGDLNWYHPPHHLHAYMRPVSSADYRLDYTLFGRWIPGYYAKSLLWYLAGLAVVIALIAGRLPFELAGATALVFALDDAHFAPGAGLAGRHMLLSLAFVFAGLLAHRAWRERGHRLAAIAAPIAFALGLLSSEAGIQAMAFVAAYELLAARGPWKTRLAALAPATLVLVLYLVIYRLRGYGVDPAAPGGDSYADPFRHPLLYLGAIGHKLPYYLTVPFVGLFREMGHEMAFPAQLAELGLTAAIFGPLALGGYRALDADARATVRWLVVGGLLSLLPAFATNEVTDEAYYCPSVTSAVVVALAASRALAILRDRGSRLWRRAIVVAPLGAVLLLHMFVPPILWHSMARRHANAGAERRRPFAKAPIPNQAREVVLLAGMPWFVRWGAGLNGLPSRPRGQVLRVISPENGPHSLTRTGDRELELELRVDQYPEGEFLPEPMNRQFVPGDVVEYGPVTLTILKMYGEGEFAVPIKWRLAFDRPLEDPSLAFLRWQDGGLVLVTPPPVGQSIALPADVADAAAWQAFFDPLGLTGVDDS